MFFGFLRDFFNKKIFTYVKGMSTKTLDLSTDILFSMRPDKQATTALYLVAAFVLLALVPVAIKIGGPAGLFGALCAFIGTGIFGKKGYDLVVDPKNQKKANLLFWNSFDCVKIPDNYLSEDTDIPIELDVLKENALIKAEYDKYSGVYLRSNLSSDSVGGNFDAFYIPENIKVVKPDSYRLRDTDSGFDWKLKGTIYTVKLGADRVVVRTADPAGLGCSPVRAGSSVGSSP